jgi:hypothetical protein
VVGQRVDAPAVQGGPTRLFDDGVVLAFTSAGGHGIDICSGSQGFRAATVDFEQLDANASGQVFSAGSGWFVRVFSLGSGQYRVELYDGAGVQQVNDANQDGVADSSFVFGR